MADHKTSLNWGGEFFDDGAYGQTTESFRLEGIYIPIGLMLEIAESRLVAKARSDTGFIELLLSIQGVGLQEPGTCYSDGINLRFQDGYHRLAACVDLGYTTFPVRLLHSDSRIRANSIQLEKLAFRYLQERDDNGCP